VSDWKPTNENQNAPRAYFDGGTSATPIDKVQVRRDTSSSRSKFIPATGEMFWATDTKKLYAGDGQTPGGIFIGPEDPDSPPSGGSGVAGGGGPGSLAWLGLPWAAVINFPPQTGTPNQVLWDMVFGESVMLYAGLEHTKAIARIPFSGDTTYYLVGETGGVEGTEKFRANLLFAGGASAPNPSTCTITTPDYPNAVTFDAGDTLKLVGPANPTDAGARICVYVLGERA